MSTRYGTLDGKGVRYREDKYQAICKAINTINDYGLSSTQASSALLTMSSVVNKKNFFGPSPHKLGLSSGKIGFDNLDSGKTFLSRIIERARDFIKGLGPSNTHSDSTGYFKQHLSEKKNPGEEKHDQDKNETDHDDSGVSLGHK